MPSKRPASDRDIKLSKTPSSDPEPKPDPDPKPSKKPHKNPNPNPNSKLKPPDPPAPKSSPAKPKPSPPMIPPESTPEKPPKKRKPRDSADDDDEPVDSDATTAAAAGGDNSQASGKGRAGGDDSVSQASGSRRAAAAAADDSVALLLGAIAFRKRTGLAPVKSNLDAFYDSVKDSLHAERTRAQVFNKLRHLRTKYNHTTDDNPGTGLNDALIRELSAEIWGGGGEKGDKRRAKKMKKDNKDNGSANAASEEVGDSELEASDVQEEEEQGNEKELGIGLDSLPFLTHAAEEIWGKKNFGDVTLETVLTMMEQMDRSKVSFLEEKWKKQLSEEMKTRIDWVKASKDLAVVLSDVHRKV